MSPARGSWPRSHDRLPLSWTERKGNAGRREPCRVCELLQDARVGAYRGRETALTTSKAPRMGINYQRLYDYPLSGVDQALRRPSGEIAVYQNGQAGWPARAFTDCCRSCSSGQTAGWVWSAACSRAIGLTSTPGCAGGPGIAALHHRWPMLAAANMGTLPFDIGSRQLPAS
jgi:hypothetical protein